MRTLISILGGGVWRLGNGQWSTCDGNAPYGGVPRFGRWRVEAAVMLYRGRLGYQDRPGDETCILAHGRSLHPGEPSNASIVLKELTELNVPREAVHLDAVSHNTHAELSELDCLSEAFHADVVWIVSNDWHLPRVRAMFEHLPNLADFARRGPQLVSCESVLLGNDAGRWKPLVEVARASGSYARVLAQEAQGVEDLKAGTYRLAA